MDLLAPETAFLFRRSLRLLWLGFGSGNRELVSVRFLALPVGDVLRRIR